LKQGLSLTRDGVEAGHSPGQEKLTSLMRMMKHDRAKMHVRAGMGAAEKKDWGLAQLVDGS
jgi:hypothetical protein